MLHIPHLPSQMYKTYLTYLWEIHKCCTCNIYLQNLFLLKFVKWDVVLCLDAKFMNAAQLTFTLTYAHLWEIHKCIHMSHLPPQLIPCQVCQSGCRFVIKCKMHKCCTCHIYKYTKHMPSLLREFTFKMYKTYITFIRNP